MPPPDHSDPSQIRSGQSDPDGQDRSTDLTEHGTLAVIGLSVTEETAYELLLRHSPATAADLAALWPAGSLPDQPLAEVLQALVGRDLADSAGPDGFVAVPPDVALDTLLLDHERELDAAAAHVERLAATYRAHEPTRPVTELVTGTRAVRQRIDALHATARHELRRLRTDVHTTTATDPPTGLPAAMSTPDSGTRQVPRRGIYARDALTDPDRFAELERRAAAGEQIRILPALSLSLDLADDRLALLVLDDDAPADHPTDDTGAPADSDDAAALVVYPGALFDVLAALFEGLWDRATPLPSTAGPPSPDHTDTDSPSEVDAHLVALMLSGGTDQAIARQLGIAHRTLARRVAALMTELGARTRFQAGVQAAFRDLAQPDQK